MKSQARSAGIVSRICGHSSRSPESGPRRAARPCELVLVLKCSTVQVRAGEAEAGPFDMHDVTPAHSCMIDVQCRTQTRAVAAGNEANSVLGPCKWIGLASVDALGHAGCSC